MSEIGSLGPQGVALRMRELNARILQRLPPPSHRAHPAFDLSGPIGPEARVGGGFGDAPIDPFSGAFEIRSAIEGSASIDVDRPGEVASTADLRALARGVAREQGIEESLFEALVTVESGFNPRAVSRAGAQGLTQLMPATARGLGIVDPFDPLQNLRGGARYLAQLLRQFGGDVRLALAAYNAGPGRVVRYGGVPPFAETQSYVDQVLQRAAMLEALSR